jgi:hypothetical protein
MDLLLLVLRQDGKQKLHLSIRLQVDDKRCHKLAVLSFVLEMKTFLLATGYGTWLALRWRYAINEERK